MKPTLALRSFLALTGSVFLAAQMAQAQSSSWLGDSAGDWTDTTKWTGGIIATGIDNTATFANVITADRIITLNADRTIGNITASDTTHNYTISGANILTLDRTSGAPIIDVTASGRTLTIASEVAGLDGLQKNGLGSLVLSGANTYTGTTTINAGTLTLNRQTGSLDATTPLTFSGTGTFNMDNVGASGALTQSLGALTFSAGQGTVQITRTEAFDQAITFASLAARSAGATGNFVNAGGTNSATNGFVFTAAPTAGTLIDRGIFFNGSSYATYDAGGFIRGFTAGDTNYLAAPTGATIGASTATSNVDLTTGNITAQTAVSANTINMRNFNITMTGSSPVLQANGLLSSGSASATLGGGTTPRLQPTTSGGEVVIRVNGGSDILTVSSVIQNNSSASRLTKSGDGKLILTGTSTYTGTTTINSGILQIGAGAAAGAISTSSAVVVNGGGNLTFNRSDGINFGSNAISGTGSVTMSGASTLTLNNTTSNTFSGGFTLNSGQVANIQNATYYGFGTGLLTLNGGQLRGVNTTNTTIIPNDIQWNASTIGFGRASGGNPTWALNGNVTLGGNVATAQIAATEIVQLIFNGNVNDGGAGHSFNFASGVNSVTFNGQNNFSGNITQSAGSVTIGGSGSLGGGNYAGVITTSGAFNYNSSATQTLSGSSANAINGLTTVTAGTLELNKSGAVNAIVNGGLTIGGNNNNAATVRYTGASSNMMGTGTVTINGRGILDFNGKTDTIGNVVVNSTGATGSNPTPIINTAGGGNLTIGTLGITPVAGFTSVINAGTGTITLGGDVTFNAATTGQAQITGTTLALGGANRNFNVGLGTSAGPDLLVDAQITGARSLTKTGNGRLTLSNTNAYTLGTTVSAGTLLLDGAFNMPSTGTLAVSNGGTFSLADGTARATTGATTGVGLTLATGSWLAFDWNGSSLDSFTTTGTATSTGTVVLNINNTSPSGSGGTLITSSGVSTLNAATYLLANNIDYTATISKTTTTVSIGAQTPATALTNAYWKGGQVAGALGTMTVSTGTLSNWASDAAGTSVGVIPGGSAVNVIFGATGAAQQASVTTGLTGMNLGSITFNDSAAVTIAGSPNIITLNSSSGTAASTSGALAAVTAGSAISVTSFANATNTISANLALGANQTWNVASGKTLVVSGVVSGTNSLTKADDGKVTLSGANTYTGATTISAGTLQIGNASTTGSLSTSSAIVNNSNLTFNRSNAVTQGTDFAAGISGTGSVTQAGSNTLTLSGTNSYEGGTVLNAGTLAFDSALSIGGTDNTGGSTAPITVNGNSIMKTVSNTAVANLGTGAIGINNGATLTLTGTSRGTFTIGGAITGTGGVKLEWGTFWGKTALNSTSNTFQGALTVSGGNDDGNSVFSINSIADGAGYGNIVLNVSSSEGDVIGLDYGTGGANGAGGGGAIAPLVLNNRQIVVQGTSTNTFNNSSNQAVTINTDLGFSGTGARSIRFGVNSRAGSGINTFNGQLSNNGGNALTVAVGGGTWILSGANNYTGTTSVTGGTLIARSATALGTGAGANVTVATNTGLIYNAAADAPLSIGGTLAITGGASTVIGTSIGTTATSAQINAAGAATISNAAHRINIYGVAGVTHATGLVTLIQGGAGSALNPATAPTLGTVYNNTDFTVGAFTRSATALQVTLNSETALGAAFWKGGLSGNTTVWAASNGTSASNWATTTGGSVQALIPGTGADVTIDGAFATAPTSTRLGADVNIKTLSLTNSGGLGLNADGYKLTITPGSSSTGITIASGVAASTIGANIGLGAAQTWTNNSDNALTVSGVISGGSALTTAGTGKVTLTGTNTYTGATTVSGGRLEVNGGSINTTSSITVAAGATFVYNSSTSLTKAPVLNGTGSLAAERAVLGGTGSINAAVTLDNIGDVLSPGNSPGIMTFETNQTWASNSYDWEINSWTADVAGTNIDQINITGILDLSAASADQYVLNVLSLTGGDVSGLVPDFTNTSNSWTILTASSITGFNASEWDINTAGFTNPDTGTWSISKTGNNLTLNYTVIPEPSSALLVGLSSLLLFRRRR